MSRIKKKKILKLIIIIAVIVAIIVFGIIFIRKHNSANTTLLTGYDVDWDGYLTSLKDQPSDIDGWSKYDKYAYGLNYEDNSDTDHDGLTDKEELEEYGSDPLSRSTAGDLYDDGYKVANDMDVKTYYEYEDDISFKYNECSEVTLTADDPTDLYAVVQDYTGYDVSEFGIDSTYKTFMIYNYSGAVSIDFSSICKKKKISISDIDIYVYEGSFLISDLGEMEKCSFQSSDDNIVTLSKDFDENSTYYILAIKKDSKDDNGFYSLLSGTLTNSTPGEEGNEVGIALIYGSPSLNQFVGITAHIMCSELDTKEKTKAFVKSVVDYSNNNVLGGDITVDDSAVEIVSAADITAKYNSLKKLIPSAGYDPSDPDSVNLLNYFFVFTYYTEEIDDGMYDSLESGESDSTVKYDTATNSSGVTSFDKYTDEFPFENFGTKWSQRGSCGGIALFTSMLYNNKRVSSSGSYTYTREDETTTIDWDISADSSNATLLDPGLYDYKSSLFVEKHTDSHATYLKGLTKGEKQFAKMIGAYQRESLDKIDNEEYMLYNGEEYKWKTIKKTMEYLEQDKIVNLGIYLTDGTGHAVNLYDYYINDYGEVVFSVYDSNFPQDQRDGFTMLYNRCYLVVKKTVNPEGKDTFQYLYYPTSGNSQYAATSCSVFTDMHYFIVFDENYNILTEK